MVLQYFVTVSDTGNKIPVEIDKSTADDLSATKENWQTDWTSELIGDPALEKYTGQCSGSDYCLPALSAFWKERRSGMGRENLHLEQRPADGS